MKLALAMTVPLALGLALPFAGFRPNRIAAPEAVWLAPAQPLAAAALALFIAAQLRGRGLAGPALLAWLVLMGWVAGDMADGAAAYARVSPGPGFWCVLAALSVLLADDLARLRPSPPVRVALLAAAFAAMAGILWAGLWDDVSILREYQSRRATFWQEAQRHLLLSLGPFAVASVLGAAIGITIHRASRLRAPVMNVLTLVQTVPSIAMFGMLMLPLGWLAAQVPALGISGIGMTPAFAALLLYALLPMVSNTQAGLAAVPASVTEAARGMGMTGTQRLWRVELPLALPVVLTGARIVLVQGIGLATVGALIGAGGFGTFVFQGLGQTAPDLILLGALPTVAMAFAAAALFDAAIETLKRRRT